MDRVFATAKLGAAYVFRHNFSGNKWENITNRKDGSSVVTFRKRGDKFFIRIAPEGGEKASQQWRLAVDRSHTCWLVITRAAAAVQLT